MSTANLISTGNIKNLVNNRVASLEYLRTVQGGTVFWINSAYITKRDLYGDLPVDESDFPLNSSHFFYLGGSLPRVVESNSQTLDQYLRTFLNLLQEYETLIAVPDAPTKSKIAGVGRRLFKSRSNKSNSNNSSSSSLSSSISSKHASLTSNKSNSHASSLSNIGTDSFDFKIRRKSSSSLFSNSGDHHHHHTQLTNNTIPPKGFNHLIIFHLPFVPDVYETFLCLCEALIEAYNHIETILMRSDPASLTPESYDTLLKVDEKVKSIIISPTVRAIDSLSKNLIYEESTNFNSLLINA